LLEGEFLRSPDPWDKRTESCDDGAHDRCAHFSSSATGFNILKLRVESGMGLCPCSCHSGCPVATSATPRPVPVQTWYESCTCPGAEPTQRLMEETGWDPRDIIGGAEEIRRKAKVRKEAFNAARARAAGKNQDEIREIYTAELRARGLNAAGGPRTDADVAWIAGNPVPMLLLEGKGLVRIGKGLREFVKLVKQEADDLDASGQEQPSQEQPADPEQ
jgi:hypothetical protein